MLFTAGKVMQRKGESVISYHAQVSVDAGDKPYACLCRSAIDDGIGFGIVNKAVNTPIRVRGAARNRLPKLIERADLKGVLHVHSRYSDGISSIEESVQECMRMGLSYLGICDHSISAHYAGGLTEADISRQHKEIDSLNRKYKNFLILKGIESDIRPDGSLDYSDSVLQKFDFVVGSVHSRFNMPEPDMTARIKRAIQHPMLTILGHPTGRLLLAREGYHVNLTELIHCAQKCGKIIELNANPHRFDLDWRYLKYAREKGVLISINPDAHTALDIKKMYFGIGIAHKGWLSAGDVVNCLTAENIHLLFQEKKK